MLEALHDLDQLVACFFVPQFTNRLHSDPSLIAVIAPSDTRMRSGVPAGASATECSTCGAPPPGSACTTA